MDRRPSESRTGRRIETVWVVVALFLYSGALFPLLMTGADGILDSAERERLRLLYLPVYLLTLATLARHPTRLAIAMSRNWPMLLLLAVPVASAAWSISQTITIRRSIALVLSMAFAYLLATRFSQRQQLAMLAGVLGTTVLMSLFAAVAMPHLAWMPDGNGLRGVFVHKNVLGWMSSATIMLGFAAYHDRLPASRRAGVALVGLGLAGVLMSGSATSLISGLLAVMSIMVVVFVSRLAPMHRPAATFLVLLAALLAAVFLTQGLVPILDLLGKDATLTGRVPLWALVDAEIADRPLLGYGYGVFWSEANPRAWQIWAEEQWQAPHAHNGYRDLLLGTGVLGLAAFCAVSIRALRQGWILSSRAPRDGWLWSFALILTTLVMNWSESTLLMQNDLLWILFVTSALTISARYAELRERPARQVRRVSIAS